MLQEVAVSYTHLDVYKRQELMVSIPPHLTAYQGFDAFFHAAEGFIAKFNGWKIKNLQNLVKYRQANYSSKSTAFTLSLIHILCFVGKKGLYISENNENNPQFDENKLVFRCFTLQGDGE